jgi:hypothetical protein
MRDLDLLLDVQIGERRRARCNLLRAVADGDALRQRMVGAADGLHRYLPLTHHLQLAGPVALVHGAELVPSSSHAVCPYSCEHKHS